MKRRPFFVSGALAALMACQSGDADEQRHSVFLNVKSETEVFEGGKRVSTTDIVRRVREVCGRQSVIISLGGKVTLEGELIKMATALKADLADCQKKVVTAIYTRDS